MAAQVNEQLAPPYIQMLYLKPLLTPKTEEIEKRKLQQLCINRVNAYQKVNQLAAQMDDEIGMLDKLIRESTTIYNSFKCFGEDNDQFWIEDNASHFFLLMIYAQNDDKINEFLRYQNILFKARMNYYIQTSDTDRIINMFSNLVESQVKQITQQEWNQIGNKLKIGSGKNLNQFKAQNSYQSFYKIPFQYVLHAVSTLNTYIEKGIAYIHIEELQKCLTEVFISKMKQKMVHIQNIRSYEEIKNNEHIAVMFDRILSTDSGNLGKQFKELTQDGLTSITVKQQSIQYFPLCMENLIDKLEEHHHLKHSGRQQIQLFFKSCGMKVGEAIKYLRMQFAPKFSEADFAKSYEYNIRHNYGLEGKRENYQCYSCSYNLKQNPGNEEYHGCPYKTLNEDTLTKLLRRKQYQDKDIKEIMELKKQNQLQKACTYVWHIKNPNSDSNLIIDNPIVFYKESLIHHKKITLAVEEEKIKQ